MIPRLPVLIVGGVILAGVFVASHPDMIDNPPGTTREACDQLLNSDYCRAAVAFNDLRQNRLPQVAAVPPLPNERRTPGSFDPAITQDNIAATICDPKFISARTPPPSWTAAMTRRMAAVLYPDQNPDNLALDQLVPIALGGAPQDQRNLWLQSWAGEANSEKKNGLETLLNRMVCSGQLKLAAAQQAVATDWIDAYRRAMTPENLARYNLPQRWASAPQIEQQPQPMTLPAREIDGPVVLQAEISPETQSYEVPPIPVN
ncbi:hypothetical protein SAMN02927924_04362 [Sphingobium faniae]|nr:hypothetical protein SAMN02927924_04362 [Sphingobium faniae]